ncbi:type II toxin-antitoxin system RelE/ParE family toxin [uncultured Desulfovibrio sp.]|uniref:type II toxin-antitoxin system RelE/ParE family toxin n=1 Tax=uncultured Desulfovibrio sp. TaxID=167968 RepID=UPI00260BFA35|nr:type II toxin-antitoxin system RelE/ParE family toxin [uncultured Desulfovibrio sp.]
MRIRWLQHALAAVDAEMSRIAQENPELAVRMYAHIRERVTSLERYPDAGRPGRIFGTRELVLDHYQYIVPYSVKDGVVEILGFFHA